MENLSITEQFLIKFKDDLITAVRVAMAEENKKRDKKMEQICNELITSYKTSTDSMMQAVIQLSSRMKISNESKHINTEPSANNGIAESNIIRLLETFDTAMNNAGKKLAESNETEVSKYIRIISEQFSNITDLMADKLSNSFNSGVDKFGMTLSGFIGEMTERNKISLQEVQQENNSELQRLADLLSKLTEQNIEFTTTSSHYGMVVSENLNRLIDNNTHIGDTVRSHINEGTEKIEQAIQRQIEQMIEKNAEHERENVDAYKKAMEDYRQEFVQANAIAIAEVQSNMILRMEETQQQMAFLAETIKNYISTVKEHELSINKQNAEFRKTLLEHSAAMSQGTTEALNNVFQVLDELREHIQENNENIKKNVDENSERMNDSINDAFKAYNKKLQELSTHIGDTLELIKKLSSQITANTESYNATLNQVTQSQKNAQELSKEDLKLLQEMMKKI